MPSTYLLRSKACLLACFIQHLCLTFPRKYNTTQGSLQTPFGKFHLEMGCCIMGQSKSARNRPYTYFTGNRTLRTVVHWECTELKIKLKYSLLNCCITFSLLIAFEPQIIFQSVVGLMYLYIFLVIALQYYCYIQQRKKKLSTTRQLDQDKADRLLSLLQLQQMMIRNMEKQNVYLLMFWF